MVGDVNSDTRRKAWYPRERAASLSVVGSGLDCLKHSLSCDSLLSEAV